MPTAAPQSFRQELYAGHVLVMQCGARAEQFLDRAGAPRRDPRAEAEALRMAAMRATFAGLPLAWSLRKKVRRHPGRRTAARMAM
jgi:hypothetical protein